jgi:hypothetical protein
MKKYFLLLSCLVLPIASYASLGGNTPSTALTTNNTNQIHSSKSYSNYKVYTTSSDDHSCIIHEFATISNSNSRIFATSWKCNTIPNLKTLLGNTNFAIFKEKPVVNTLNYKKYVSNDIIVILSGHENVSYGQAYFPNNIPNHINIEDLFNNEKF